MKFKELKIKSESEIKQLLSELKAKAHAVSVKMRLGEQKNLKELRGIKKDIARILTFLHNSK